MTAERRRPIVWLAAIAAIGFAAWFLLRGPNAAVVAEAARVTGSTSDRPPAPLAEPELAGSGSRPSGAAGKTTEDSADPDSAWRPPDLVTVVEFVDAATGVRVRGCELAPPDARPRRAWTVQASWFGVPVPERGGEFFYRIGLSRVGVLVPDGYVVVARTPQPSTLVHRARSFRVVQPAHREQTVRVTFVDAGGQTARGGRVAAWRVGDVVEDSPVVESNASGIVRLRGVPSIPGALLRLRCEREVDGESIELAPIPEEVEAARALFESPFQWLIPTSPDKAIDARVSIASLSAPSILDVVVTDNDVPTEVSLGEGQVPEVGSVRVELRGRDGRPIDGAKVSVSEVLGWTESDGAVTFVGVPVGHHSPSVREPGRPFEALTTYVAPNTETRLTMNEIEGGTLDVEVVDADGSPAPFAVFSVHPASGPTWVDLDDAGEQRLDPFTDVRGCRTCGRIAPGTVTVTAHHGDGHAKAEVELRNGERKTLRLELR